MQCLSKLLTVNEQYEQCIRRLNLLLKVGETTEGDGSCFVRSLRQNMMHYKKLGLWTSRIPDDCEALRAEIIDFMERNRDRWTRSKYNEELKRFQDPAYTDTQFDALLTEQRTPRAWTDDNGVMVEAACLYLNIQLNILLPAISGPILPSGLGGPYQIINKATSTEPRLNFYVGLLNQHYQFLKLLERMPSPKSPSSLNFGSRFERKQTPSSPKSTSPLNRQQILSSPKSPSPLKFGSRFGRSRLISKYLKSPPAKRQLKEEHCVFCPGSFTAGVDLETHLNNSSDCQRYYQRNFKVKSILAIVVKLFPCIFCSATGKNWKISNHLKQSESCLKKYNEKFNTNNLKDLQKKLELLRKQLRPSVVNRKLELEKRSIKQEEKNEKKTEVELLNEFRRQTSFNNVLLCVRCGANYCQSSKRINALNPNPEEADDLTMMQKRRLEKFHQCQECISADAVKAAGYGFVRLENNNQVLYSPAVNGAEVNQMGPTNNSDMSKNVTFLLPSSIECLDSLKNKPSKQQSVGIIYKLNVDNSSLFTNIHNSEMAKYNNLKVFGDRYEGVMDSTTMTLNQAEKVISDATIVGSDSWKRINIINMSDRLQQLGNVCCVLNLKVPMHSDDVLATCQIMEGNVVSVEYHGDSTNELSTKYFVHTSHKSDVDCSNGCVKLSLSDYLQSTNFDSSQVKSRYLSAYITSVQQKFNNLIKHFIKGPLSTLHAEQYYLQLYFHLDNTVDIRGFTWPGFLHDLNISIGKNQTLFTTEIKEELTKKVESVVFATSHQETLVTALKLSDEKCKDLINQILQTQVHNCTLNNCDTSCEFPKLPLLKTSVTEWSPNVQTCKQFNSAMKILLRQLSDEKVSSLTTEQWLLETFSSGLFIGDIVDDKILEVRSREMKYCFTIDDRLMDLIVEYLEKYKGFENNPLIACYHYSASTGFMSEVGGVSVRKPLVKDAFLTEYSVPVLKAFGSRVEVTIRNGFEDGVKAKFQHLASKPNWYTSVEIDEGLSTSHQEVSMSEAFTLFDKKLLRSGTSNPVEFIYAVENRKKFFKKVSSPTEKSIQEKRTGKHFEPQLTSVDRFFLRCSSVKLCLAEFVLHYDYVGSQESENLFKLFKLQGVEVQNSEIRCAATKEFLPEFLCLSNGDVMKIRSNKKIISYPNVDVQSPNYNYQQVLLYSPEVEETMKESKVTELFWRKDDPPILNEDGDMMTTIQRVKRELFPKANWNS